MALAGMSVDDLARRCAEETDRYSRREVSDEQFCFELLRRALAEGAADAFTRVYQIYERRVLGWVLAHGLFARTGESADFFATEAWSAFYFALRGPKFAGFASLSRVLQYLKVCVHTAIVQHVRDQQPAPSVPIEIAAEPAETPDMDARAVAAEIWRRVELALPDEQDRLLARCVFVEDLKPRQIIAFYPGRWRDEREISVDLYRIRRTLRKDPELRGLLGLEDDEDAQSRGVGETGDTKSG